jgi:hypothetical protein
MRPPDLLMRVGLDLHPRGMLAIQSLRLAPPIWGLGLEVKVEERTRELSERTEQVRELSAKLRLNGGLEASWAADYHNILCNLICLAASGSNGPDRVYFQRRWFPAGMGLWRDGDLHVVAE